jgi:DNA-binding CsgD family transcriptional regulator/PAS domain-containing protein
LQNDTEVNTVPAELTLQAFSELVGSIYTAALDPNEWTRFARLLAEATNSTLGGVGVLDAATNEFTRTFAHGAPPGYFERFKELAPINPMLPYATLCKPGDLIVNSVIVPEAEYVNSHFHRAFSQPLGLRDAMILVCLRSGPRVAFIGINRGAGQPLYTPEDGELLKLLSPHVCRAMTISDAFDLKTIKSEALEEALDGLSAGVFLLDADGRVVHTNQSAAHMIAAGGLISIRDQRLRPLNAASRDAMAAALVSGCATGISAGAGAPTIALLDVDGTTAGMIATLLPLEQARRSLLAEAAPSVSGTTQACWALFVQDPHVALPMPGEAFAKLYKLTPAELRVALALAPGLTPEAAADMMGIALPTLRTHMQRIFAKTGTNRHADLVRLMLSTMPPVSGRPPAER